MGQYNKLLCLLFVLFIVLLLQKHCKVKEGLDNLNSFTNCIDDPEWFVENSDTGRRMYCSDIGNGVSCYDRNAGQVEGWERCLQTCGNCATTEVTVADMRNLATFAGDPIEDFGVVLFRDDDLKWVGKGVDEEGSGSDDIRNFTGMDESEDIVDIYDRLNAIEGLYEMLMGSVSSCVDCSQYESSGECGGIDYCQWNNDSCGTKDGSDDKFYGCNGTNIECDISEVIDDDSTESDLKSQDHTYIQHDCEDGPCKIVFPTVEMSCNEVSGLLDNEIHGTYSCMTDDDYLPTGTCSPATGLDSTDTLSATSTCPSETTQSECIDNMATDGSTPLCAWSEVATTPDICKSLSRDDCISNSNPGCRLKTKQDVCQSYFLLETSLTQGDDNTNCENIDDSEQCGTTDGCRVNAQGTCESDDGNADYPNRISLYDMCPRQCTNECSCDSGNYTSQGDCPNEVCKWNGNTCIEPCDTYRSDDCGSANGCAWSNDDDVCMDSP